RPDRWNARKPTAPGSRSRLSVMTEVGASRNLSRSDRAGRGMLSMATVTVMVRSALDVRRRQRATEQPGDRTLPAELSVRQQPYQITALGWRRLKARTPAPAPPRSGPTEPTRPSAAGTPAGTAPRRGTPPLSCGSVDVHERLTREHHAALPRSRICLP